MTQYWTDLVRRLTPYVPGEQRAGTDIVKLNTNENPYPPSAQVLSAVAAVDGHALRRYPDPEAFALRHALADYHGVSVDQVFVGNGSDEILALAFLAFFTDGRRLQFPDVSYSFYPVYCDLYGIDSQLVKLDGEFVLDLDRIVCDAGGIVFPNPNAPTSVAVELGAIKRLLANHTQGVVLLDEAYADFGAHSAIPLINEYPNLLISQTFSKARSLAGLRLGMAFGDAQLIEAMHRVKNSFNSYPVDVVAQRAGIASLADEPYYRQCIKAVIDSREGTAKELIRLGFKVLPSAANFIFVSPPNGQAAALFTALRKHGVLVRYWPKAPIEAWLRISIGTEREMQILLSVIGSVLKVD